MFLKQTSLLNMFLRHLHLVNFRNYKEAKVEFSPKINWIIGDNAQGKTNLLEALYFLSTGRSFRTYHLTDLIYHGAKFFYLEAEFLKEGITQTIQILFEPPKQQIKLNQTLYKNFTHLLGMIPAILYTPEDVCLITGIPAQRRKFLDLHIAQVDPLYLHHLSRYFRAMKQRNHLLRQKKTQEIKPWEQSMAQAATYIVEARQKSIARLNPPLSSYMQKLSQGQDDIHINYSSTLPSPETDKIFDHYEKQRHKEIAFGSTLFGPHRDDLQIHMKEKLAKTFSSEGQKRSIIASLRLAEWERVKSITDVTPLFCIDDFSTYLDASRLLHLKQETDLLGQVFLTSPEEVNDLFKEKHLLHVEKGHVRPAISK